MTGTGHTTWALTAVMLASTKDVPKVRCQCSVDDWLAQNLEALLNLEAISLQPLTMLTLLEISPAD